MLWSWYRMLKNSHSIYSMLNIECKKSHNLVKDCHSILCPKEMFWHHWWAVTPALWSALVGRLGEGGSLPLYRLTALRVKRTLLEMLESQDIKLWQRVRISSPESCHCHLHWPLEEGGETVTERTIEIDSEDERWR